MMRNNYQDLDSQDQFDVEHCMSEGKTTKYTYFSTNIGNKNKTLTLLNELYLYQITFRMSKA